MRVPKLVQKWLLFFDSWDLRAGSYVATISELFTVSTLFKSAKVPHPAE
jgi:hypothetical protein